MQRQAENRHMQALQAMTFLFEYYDIRCDQEPKDVEDEMEKEMVKDAYKQEADYNVARSFQHLGLTHLALPYYQLCLDASDKWKKRGKTLEGDLVWEAAYNLEMIYVTSGNPAAAMEVAEKWLVI